MYAHCVYMRFIKLNDKHISLWRFEKFDISNRLVVKCVTFGIFMALL